MRRHEPNHFEMLLSVESIDEGLERFIFVLVHLEEPVLAKLVGGRCEPLQSLLDDP